MYKTGRGVESVPREAFALYERAAALGEPDAFFNLALMYESGSGVKQDVDRAFKLYAEAGRRGHPRAVGMFGGLVR
jgi:TPR repeat protein